MKTNVSIIIPIYNVELYIEACLQSVVNQTRTDEIECIIVDDCGTDNSMKIAEQFVAGYKGNIDFHILHHEHNKGLSVARNTGIKHAKGEYVLFVDSDDELYPNALDSFLGVLNLHPGIDLIQGAYNPEAMIRYKGVVLPEYTYDRKEIKTLMLDYDKVPIMAQNRLIKKKLIEDHHLYFKEGIIHEDCYWTYFLAKHVRSLACTVGKTYFYRVNPNSITGCPNREKEIYSFRVIIEDFCDNIDGFLPGVQKRLIWYLLLQVWGNGYYNGQEDKKQLFHCLYHQCSWYEKTCMQLWYILPDGLWIKGRLVNFIVRLFKLNF